MRRIAYTDKQLDTVANRADRLNIYTVNSENKATMYMFDGKYIGLYFHGGMIKMTIDEAATIAEELKGLVSDVEQLKRMKIEFRGAANGREKTKI